MATITSAGEQLIAEKIATDDTLSITRFIYANVPGLDAQQPVNRAEPMPPAAQIVYRYDMPYENKGFVNPNQVVYSSMLGSDIGDFDWNWLGLETAEGVLFAVAYVPLQQKRRNVPPLQIGNNVTRNILVEFSGAQALTGITIDASTWQHDFTTRLAGIDERERVNNRDIYGRACFFGTGMQLAKVNESGGYSIKAGQAYIEGLRVIGNATPVAVTTLPTTVWIDVVLERYQNDKIVRWTLGTGQQLRADYTDASGSHYCIPIADVTQAGIVDRRVTQPISGPLVEHFASRKSVSDLEDGTTSAGKAKQLTTARKIAVSGAGTGEVSFDGSKDVSIELTLADSNVQVGTWTKVQVNQKGLVVSGGNLAASDIPYLDWSKINTGKPTTLSGYGITDALRTGYSGQVPHFYAPSPGAGSSATALEIREVGLVGDQTRDSNYAPRINFHWGGVAIGDLSLQSSTGLCWNGQAIYHTGNLDPSAIIPPGTLIQSFSTAVPPGYLRTNGAAVSRAAFSRLFAQIGGWYGVGDGSTTFNLPDTRGLFIRDMDDGRQIDPGRAFSGVQYSQNLSHNHYAVTGDAGWHSHAGSSIGVAGEHSHKTWRGLAKNNASVEGNGGDNQVFDGDTSAAGAHTHSLYIAGDGTHAHSVSVGASGGNESRPINMAIYFYIKY